MRLAAGRLDETLEILEMIVRAHAVLLAEHVVLAAVVSHVDEKIKIHPTDGILDQALAVAGLKAGAFAINDESILCLRAARGHLHQVVVHLRSQLARTLRHNQSKGSRAFSHVKDCLRVHMLHQKPTPLRVVPSFYTIFTCNYNLKAKKSAIL